ncbi:MAG: hypothetical protein ACYCOR_16880 [Acidobacteriaceae bacterium]
MSYSVLVGTAGTRRSPVGNITVFVIFPNGSKRQVDGPHAVVSNGNGTSSYSGSIVASVPPGVYQAYAIFTPTAGGSQPGSSNTLTVTVTP